MCELVHVGPHSQVEGSQDVLKAEILLHDVLAAAKTGKDAWWAPEGDPIDWGGSNRRGGARQGHGPPPTTT
eukprot:3377483-Pyramimonas_sp.AAC.1